jgi:hypothetical protein
MRSQLASLFLLGLLVAGSTGTTAAQVRAATRCMRWDGSAEASACCRAKSTNRITEPRRDCCADEALEAGAEYVPPQADTIPAQRWIVVPPRVLVAQLLSPPAHVLRPVHRGERGPPAVPRLRTVVLLI